MWHLKAWSYCLVWNYRRWWNNYHTASENFNTFRDLFLQSMKTGFQWLICTSENTMNYGIHHELWHTCLCLRKHILALFCDLVLNCSYIVTLIFSIIIQQICIDNYIVWKVYLWQEFNLLESLLNFVGTISHSSILLLFITRVVVFSGGLFRQMDVKIYVENRN